MAADRARHVIAVELRQTGGSTDDRERGLQAGFDTYLVKPVDPNALARLLSAA